MIAKNKTTKFISAFLIISILLPTVLFSTPKKAEAIPVADWLNTAFHSLNNTFNGTTAASTVTNTGVTLKNFAIEIGKQLLKVAAKRLLAQMTQATINWINSGFHGSPLFLENPESFFRDIAKSEIRNLVDMIGYDTFRFPFGKEVALQVIDSYKSQLATNAQYTLSKVINDPDLLVRYRNDFNVGGWNGFLINTQYPQNNYLGFNMIIKQNLASRLEGAIMTPAQMVKDKLQQGMGFLSPQTCPSNPNYNNGINEFKRPSFNYNVPYPQPEDVMNPQNDPAYDQAVKNWKQGKAVAQANWNSPTGPNFCPDGLVSTTPGSVAANQVFSALNTPFLTTALDGALGNSVAAIFDALINKLLDTGLNALASTINPAPREDNWSYDGNTLGGNSTTVVAGALNIPQNVSASVGQGTSTIISGGTAPFNIIPQTVASRAIATATISVSSSSGPKLTVIGVAPGTTSITVFDSSTPSKTANVIITINDIGALVATPPNILTNINNPIVIAISGGEGNYSIQTGPDEEVAVAVLSDTNLIVIGVAPGTTYVEIKDSSPISKTIRVNITIVDPTVLKISQENVLAYTGRTTNINISGGKKRYVLAGTMDPEVAIAKIVGDIISITGTGQGETSILFRDSSLPPKTATIFVAVVHPLVVSPQNVSANIQNNLDRTAVASISGGLPPYSFIQTSESMKIATADILGSRLTVTANMRGTTSVLVKDSSIAYPQTFIVNITVD